MPSAVPTSRPRAEPTAQPSDQPSSSPSGRPTRPTQVPTQQPTPRPTPVPACAPFPWDAGLHLAGFRPAFQGFSEYGPCAVRADGTVRLARGELCTLRCNPEGGYAAADGMLLCPDDVDAPGAGNRHVT